MSKHSFVMQVQPGYEDEYQRRHDKIWPELVKDIKAAGFRNYSIWRYGLTLFAYFETDDFDETIRKLSESNNMARWGEYMTPIMKAEIDPATNFPFQLPLIWKLEE